MKRFLLYVLLSLSCISLHAQDIERFKELAAKADSAYSQRNMELVCQLNQDMINLFTQKREQYIKDNEICPILFAAYCQLSLWDKSLTEAESCQLLAQGLSIVKESTSWIKNYPTKDFIVNSYISLISSYAKLGKIDLASIYNEEMISFAEQHYRTEISNILFSAISMYILMDKMDKLYALYLRLSESLEELDRHQQKDVVQYLMYYEFEKKDYFNVIQLYQKHKKLIDKSKDNNIVLGFIGLSFLGYAQDLARDTVYSETTNEVFLSGCNWTYQNYSLLYPKICIEYAYWLYGSVEHLSIALTHFDNYLTYIENNYGDNAFDGSYRQIEDAEMALISILTQKIIISPVPTDLNEILGKFPKIVSKINNSPASEYFEDFNHTVKRAKGICYGE